MALAEFMSAVYTALNGIQTTYHLQAPQDVDRPFFVLQLFGGPVMYCFGGDAIEQPRLQITQYYDWTGQEEEAIADNLLIVAALDEQVLVVADGIMMQRLNQPRSQVLDGNVLQMRQDWKYEYLS